jgi:PAS domain S-box-containing protein
MKNQIVDLSRIFPGDSEMAHRMRQFDWSSTDFGSPETWPENLRAAVGLSLPSRFPILLWWGPQFALLYNDAYLPWLSDAKRLRALARPGRETWNEIWDIIGPMLERVWNTGRATWSEDMQFYFVRKLPREEVYITFSFAPILAADGKTVDGILTPCTETTEKVVGARRLETLRRLGICSTEGRTRERVCQEAVSVLRENPRDVPFAAIYVLDDTGKTARMADAVLLQGEHGLPESVGVGDFDCSFWPFASVFQHAEPRGVAISPTLGLIGRAWPDPVTEGLLLPIPGTAPDRLAGIFVAGIGPRCVLDSAYRTFFDLAARHIGSALADARAYEEERKRAEALAELDRAKTAFFSNISHEFRTPLTLILGPTQEARNAPDRALRGSELELVYRNELRLLKLVNSLLDFSRIEAGRIEAVYEPTDIGTFTAELASTFRSAMQRAGLKFEVDCPPVSEPIFVDHDMWEKIVLNLISNAFKFTFHGKVSVSVRSTDHQVELEVSDTGIGIPEHELPHIFERFHRVATGHGRSYEGTGIGLALVQELAKIHGGAATVRSTEKRGSTFIVRIPKGKDHLSQNQIGRRHTMLSSAVRAESYVEEALRWLPGEMANADAQPTEIKPDPTASIISALPDPPKLPGSELILLADDNADMRDYVRRLLSDQYRVLTVSNGADALKAARESGADLILADVMMPILDGFGLLRALRADPHTKLKPIILLSARAGEASRVEGLDKGADDYLVKPFTARELVARVGAHLKMSRDRAEAAETERRLRGEVEAERNRLRDAFAQAPSPIAIFHGHAHHFAFANEAYLTIVGRPPEGILGMSIRELFPELSGQGYFEILDKVYETGEIFAGKEAAVKLTRFGKMDTVYLDFTLLPLRDTEGKIDGVLFQGNDVTEKMLTRTRLEERVTERTAELQNAQVELRALNQQLLLAQEDERRRLAVELHDGAGQWLVALKWRLESLPWRLERNPQQIPEGLNDCLELLDSLSQELRTVSHLLHPPLLEEAGLPVALQQYVEGLFERSGLAVTLQIDPAFERLPREVEATVFRIVQEALTNVHRHANTKSSVVRIKSTLYGIAVEIQDKGSGIPGFKSIDNPNVKLGVGIQGMRERVRHLRGSFDVQSSSSGTTINVILPATGAAWKG